MESAMTRRSEAGQALVFAALAMTILLGFAGLAIDMGMLRHDKRLQQTAADAGAIAGASNLAYGGVMSGAQSAAATNGFADNGGGQVSACSASAAVGTVCVQVNNPPADATVNGVTISGGPHSGNDKYVEVLVSVVQPTYFMKALGITKQVVTARAVATNLGGGASSGCLYTLGAPSDSIEGVNINGSATLNAPNCGIVDNGNYNTKGNNLTVNADTFGVSGSGSVSGPGGTVTCTQPGACPAYDMPAATDPLASLPSPCTLGYTCTGGPVVSISGSSNSNCGSGCTYDASTNTYTVSPGNYCSITIQGVASDSVVFSPGIYIIDGTGSGCSSQSLNIPGNATITGDGVMFYFTNSSTIDMTGTPTINLTAPNAANCPACPSEYTGILMYQDPNDTNVGPSPNGPRLGGDTGSSFNGVLYFPNDQITFYGNNTSFSVGVVISQSLALSGNPTVTLEGPAGLPPGTNLILHAVLVE
jgi:hypothetical protein